MKKIPFLLAILALSFTSQANTIKLPVMNFEQITLIADTESRSKEDITICSEILRTERPINSVLTEVTVVYICTTFPDLLGTGTVYLKK